MKVTIHSSDKALIPTLKAYIEESKRAGLSGNDLLHVEREISALETLQASTKAVLTLGSIRFIIE